MLHSYCKKISSTKIFLVSVLIIFTVVLISLLLGNKQLIKTYNTKIQYGQELQNNITKIKEKINTVININNDQISARLSDYSNQNNWIQEIKGKLAVIQENNKLCEPFRINIKNPIEVFDDCKGNVIKMQKLEFNVNLNQLDNFVGIVSDIKKILPYNSVLVYCEIISNVVEPKIFYNYNSNLQFHSRIIFNIYTLQRNNKYT